MIHHLHLPVFPIFNEIVAIVGGTLLQQRAPLLPLSHLLLDSRRVSFVNTSVFFAIVGATHNGHQYIAELYAKGLRRFVVSQSIDLDAMPDADVLQVADTIAALQAIAAWWRQKFDMPVVGITGSNGKTIVKEWLHQLLCEQYYIVRSPKSYNSQIGVPLSVWQMAAQHDLAIFEAGISQCGEMARLAAVIQPTIGILTNIGAAHDKGFGSRLEKTIEKLHLFRHAQLLLYRADYGIVHEAIEQLRQQYPDDYVFDTLSWTLTDLAMDHEAERATETLPIVIHWVRRATHTDISFVWPTQYQVPIKAKPTDVADGVSALNNGMEPQRYAFSIPFTDDAYLENAIHAILLSLYMGLNNNDLMQGVKRLQPVAMRLEMKSGINNCSIINDAYSADLDSLAIALDFMAQQQQHSQKTVILSDILESGQARTELYTQIADLLQQRGVSRFIGIGDRVLSCASIFAKLNATFFRQTGDFLAANVSFKNETILVKGARTFFFEKIVAHLEQKNHSTVLEINLDAIAHNFKVYRGLLRPDVKMMVMVKAFSYGSGTYEVANLLQYHKADYLAVAYTDEGIALRHAGIKLPIMVLNPLPETFEILLRYDLEPEIYSYDQGKQFLQHISSKTNNARQHYPIHLKLDTGMHRLGFEMENLTKILPLLCNNDDVKIVSILTHLSASDEAEHDSFSIQQFERFNAMCYIVEEVIGYKIWRHALNSTGIVRFPQMQADMVRLGLGLYGFDSSGIIQSQLMQVGKLKTYISQIKTVPPNETVGYGRRGKLSKLSRIATVSIGYADGLSRRLSNGRGAMLVSGQLAPIVGNVCMDMTMIDITHIDNVQVEDEVIVFGDQIPVQTLAKQLDTIPYEILTSVSNRVKRVYYQAEN